MSGGPCWDSAWTATSPMPASRCSCVAPQADLIEPRMRHPHLHLRHLACASLPTFAAARTCGANACTRIHPTIVPPDARTEAVRTTGAYLLEQALDRLDPAQRTVFALRARRADHARDRALSAVPCRQPIPGCTPPVAVVAAMGGGDAGTTDHASSEEALMKTDWRSDGSSAPPTRLRLRAARGLALALGSTRRSAAPPTRNCTRWNAASWRPWARPERRRS